MSAPPKPPPGFKLIEPEQSAAVPPPPPGFKLIEPPVAQPAPSLPTGSTDALGSASQTGTALRSFGQGASFGFSDELNGAVIGLVAAFGREGLNMLKTGPGRALLRSRMGEQAAQLPDAAIDAIAEESFRQTNEQVTGMKTLPQRGADGDDALRAGYRHGRDDSRLELVQGHKANPITSAVANVAGGIAAPLPGAGGLKGLAKAGRLAKVGAATGAASGVGYSDADEENEGITDAALGAATGGVLSPLAGVAGDKLGPALKKASQNNALKAIGTKAGIDNVLSKMGYETADEARSLGQFALDTKLIKPFGKAEGVMERAGFGKQATGARIEGVLSDADAVGPFDSSSASWKAVEEVLGPDGLNPTAIRAGGKSRRLVEDIARLPETQDSTFRNANKMKSDMYDGINWGADTNLQTRMQRSAVRGLRKSIEEQAGDLLGSEAVDELRAANQAYGKYADVQSLARDEATRQLGRKSLTALDIGAAGAAGGVAGVGGAMTVLGSKLLGSRIPSLLAVGQQAAAPRAAGFLEAAVKPAIQAPLKPSLPEEEEDAIQAFLSGG